MFVNKVFCSNDIKEPQVNYIRVHIKQEVRCHIGPGEAN